MVSRGCVVWTGEEMTDSGLKISGLHMFTHIYTTWKHVSSLDELGRFMMVQFKVCGSHGPKFCRCRGVDPYAWRPPSRLGTRPEAAGLFTLVAPTCQRSPSCPTENSHVGAEMHFLDQDILTTFMCGPVPLAGIHANRIIDNIISKSEMKKIDGERRLSSRIAGITCFFSKRKDSGNDN